MKPDTTKAMPVRFYDISDELIAFVEANEGLALNAYTDTGGVWTIGYGHTGNVHAGMHITKEDATTLLRADLTRAIATLRTYVTAPLTKGMFIALADFIFNVGPTAFRKSTLLHYLNQRDYAHAAQEFARWRYDNGHVIPGLVNRRTREQRAFLE